MKTENISFMETIEIKHFIKNACSELAQRLCKTKHDSVTFQHPGICGKNLDLIKLIKFDQPKSKSNLRNEAKMPTLGV